MIRRTCSRCGITKYETEFHKSQPGYICKKCSAEYQRAHKYGLTPAMIEELRTKQYGLCAICGYSLGPKFNVDHDHETGMVRGLLCYPCNTALGKFQESERILLSAIAYLRANRSISETPTTGILTE